MAARRIACAVDLALCLSFTRERFSPLAVAGVAAVAETKTPHAVVGTTAASGISAASEPEGGDAAMEAAVETLP